MPHETARRRMRRQIHYKMTEGGGVPNDQRRLMTPDEVEELHAGMDSTTQARFGLIKLTGLNLDCLYPSPEGLTFEPHVTLVTRAVWLHKDRISWALLRAGADPTVRHGHETCPEASADARACILRVAPQNAVWIVRQFIEMRAAWAATGEGGLEKACVACAQELHAPVVWKECGHVCCEGCVWSDFLASGKLACASCGVKDEGGPEDSVPERADSCAHERKAASLAAYELLPRTLPTKLKKKQQVAHSESFVVTKEPFVAKSPEEMLYTSLGISQGQRCSSLWTAAREGNVPRLKAVIDTGANVDATNEYGQSALMLASWHGHAGAVKFLCGYAAADMELRAFGGTTCCTAAAANGHTLCLKALINAGADAGKPGGGERTPYQHAIVNCYSEVADVLRSLNFGKEGEEILGPEEARDGKVVTGTLIANDSDHPGAGSYTIDGLGDGSLDRLSKLFRTLVAEQLTEKEPQEVAEEETAEEEAREKADDGEATADSMSRVGTWGVNRVYFCDAEGWVRRMITALLEESEAPPHIREALPYMRFLYYKDPGGQMAPHVDLAKKAADGTGPSSTRTLLLYLEGCRAGGETVLLEREGKTIERSGEILGRVKPEKGRLLVFPHKCPHAGLRVVDAPKVLLRGEIF